MTRAVTDAEEREEFLEAIRCGGVTCIFQNAGEEGNDPLGCSSGWPASPTSTDMLRGLVSKAVTPDDVVAAKKAGKHCLYLTGNGVPLAAALGDASRRAAATSGSSSSSASG